MPPPGHNIIIVGASAGGVEALSALVQTLPAAVFVTLHLPSHGVSALPQILSRRGPLPALHPQDHTPLQHGRIYVAPPDHHLIISDGQPRRTRPKTNCWRARSAIRRRSKPSTRSCSARWSKRITASKTICRSSPRSWTCRPPKNGKRFRSRNSSVW